MGFRVHGWRDSIALKTANMSNRTSSRVDRTGGGVRDPVISPTRFRGRLRCSRWKAASFVDLGEAEERSWSGPRRIFDKTHLVCH